MVLSGGGPGSGSARLVLSRDDLAKAGWRLDIPPRLLDTRVPLPRSPALDSEDAPDRDCRLPEAEINDEQLTFQRL